MIDYSTSSKYQSNAKEEAPPDSNQNSNGLIRSTEFYHSRRGVQGCGCADCESQRSNDSIEDQVVDPECTLQWF